MKTSGGDELTDDGRRETTSRRRTKTVDEQADDEDGCERQLANDGRRQAKTDGG